MSIAKSKVVGVVLTGGQSVRMGTNKATMRIGGTPLWEIAEQALRPLTDRVLFVGSAQTLGSAIPRTLIDDDPPGLGPLGGIVTGLEKSGYPHHLVLAVDYPLVQQALLRLLLRRADGVLAVCGQSPEYMEPLLAYYHVDCVPVIRQMLAEGERQTYRLYERVPSVVLTEAEYDGVDPERLSQINVNTPADLERASAIYKRMRRSSESKNNGDK
jgi:molybdopterin-guanine dinucleotide biosynthesis protein A